MLWYSRYKSNTLTFILQTFCIRKANVNTNFAENNELEYFKLSTVLLYNLIFQWYHLYVYITVYISKNFVLEYVINSFGILVLCMVYIRYVTVHKFCLNLPVHYCHLCCAHCVVWVPMFEQLYDNHHCNKKLSHHRLVFLSFEFSRCYHQYDYCNNTVFM